MADLAELLGRGDIEPHIDRPYGLEDTAEAMAYVESGTFQGKVVITP